MSYHAKTSETAREDLKKQKQKSTVASLVCSILFLAIIGVLLALLTIITPTTEIETIISYQAPSIEEAEDTQEQKIQTVHRQVQPPSASSAAVANIITSVSPSNIVVPDIDNVSVDSMDFGQADDFGMGEGFGVGDGFFGDAGEGMTAFGSSSSGGMKGFLFDLKQDERMENNDLGDFYASAGDYGQRASKFMDTTEPIRKDSYSFPSFDDYFKSKKALNLNYLVVKKQAASVATEAFEAADTISPSGWTAVYEGKILSNAKTHIRFLGRFDDILIVYVNDRVVFDGSWQPGYTSKFNDMENVDYGIRINGTTPMKMGKYVKLKKGDTIRFVVGEVPGGFVGGGLFIEEKGVENPGLEAGGDYKLVPFCTKPLTSFDKGALLEIDLPIETENVPFFPVE